MRPNSSHDIAVSSGSSPRCASSSTCFVELVVLGDEHLAERARVDEAQQPALRERDHDVRVLRRLLARRSSPAAADPTCRGGRRARRRRRAAARGTSRAARRRRDLVAHRARSMNSLRLLVTAHRAHAVDLDRLDLLADDLLLEIAAHDLDLRQLRHRSLPRAPSAPRRCRPCPRDPRRGLLGLLLRTTLALAVRARRRRAPSRRSASRDRGPRRARGSAGGRSHALRGELLQPRLVVAAAGPGGRFGDAVARGSAARGRAAVASPPSR